MKNAMKLFATIMLGTIAAVWILPDRSEQHDSDSRNAPKQLVAEHNLTNTTRPTPHAVSQIN
jgi:hypothetical protein